MSACRGVVKERLREFYRCTDIHLARTMLSELIAHCLRPGLPAELHKLACTLKAWYYKICNFHIARVSNGPTEALNRLCCSSDDIGIADQPDFGRCRRLAWSSPPYSSKVAPSRRSPATTGSPKAGSPGSSPATPSTVRPPSSRDPAGPAPVPPGYPRPPSTSSWRYAPN